MRSADKFPLAQMGLDGRNTAKFRLPRPSTLAILFSAKAQQGLFLFLFFNFLPNTVSKTFSTHFSEKVGGRLSLSLRCGASMTCAYRDDAVLGFADLHWSTRLR